MNTSPILTITEESMTSNVTHHHAVAVRYGWVVSWLPDRVLTRNEAITAVSLAEEVKTDPGPGHRDWPLIRDWAAELGLTGPEALERITYGPFADPDLSPEYDAPADHDHPGGAS